MTIHLKATQTDHQSEPLVVIDHRNKWSSSIGTAGRHHPVRADWQDALLFAVYARFTNKLSGAP
jgi:hypothetical protein